MISTPYLTPFGRREIRKAIYMAALVGSKHNDILRDFYKRLLEKGKPKKLALIAVMRKLLTHLNSLMKKHLHIRNPAAS